MRDTRNLPETPQSFGERLYFLRLNKGMTQAEVALPRFTKQYISMLEGGRARPSFLAMEYIAQRLGVTVSELLGGAPPGSVNLATISTHELLAEVQRRMNYPV